MQQVTALNKYWKENKKFRFSVKPYLGGTRFTLQWLGVNDPKREAQSLDVLNTWISNNISDITTTFKTSENYPIEALLTPKMIDFLDAWEASKKLLRGVSRLRYRNKPIKFVCWDTETENLLSPEEINSIDPNKTVVETVNTIKEQVVIRPFLLCYKEIGKECINVLDKYTGFRPFFEYLHRLAENNTVILIAHNASFDLNSVKPVIAEFPDLIKNFYTKNNQRDTLISGYLEFTDGLKVHLNDTFLFFNKSLEEASGDKKPVVPYGITNLRVRKGVMYYWSFTHYRYETFKWKAYIEYCKDDIRSLEKITIRRFEIIESVYNLLGKEKDTSYLFGITQSGLSKLYMTETLEYKNYIKYYRWETTLLENQITELSKIGGLTATCGHFVKTDENTRIYKFDVCSQYPYIMVSGLPKKKWENKPLPYWKKWCEWVVVDFHKMPTLKEEFTPFTSLFNTQFTRLIKKMEEGDEPIRIFFLRQYWSLIEKMFSDLYRCAVVVGSKYQEIGNEFNTPYKRLYYLKKECDDLREAGDNSKEIKLKREMIKIVLNGGYGKTMQKTYPDSTIHTKDDTFHFANLNVKYQACHTGIFISSMGRVMLLNALLYCQRAGFEFLYCDTDSITFKAPIDDPRIWKFFKKNGRDAKKDLGTWELEGVYTEGYFWSAKKKYVLIPEGKNPEYAEKGFAFGGIKGLQTLARYLYLNNEKKFRELMELLTDQNPCFIRCKTFSRKTAKYGQSFIASNDVIWDRNKKPTHKILIFNKGDRYDFRNV